jgi:hyperosmotically inducible periplasmic protein
MRKFFNGLVLGLVFGAVGYWFMETKVRQHPQAQQRFETSANQAKTSVTEAAGYFSDAFTAKLEALDLLPSQIKEELAQTGMVIRRKAHDIDKEVVNAAADARIVAAIKGEYAVDPNLSVWQTAVSCNQGHVALSGMVSTPDDIGRAIALALETDGVRDVTSTLQVKNSGLAVSGR